MRRIDRALAMALLLTGACSDPTDIDGLMAQEGTIVDQTLQQLGVVLEDSLKPGSVLINGESFDGFAVEFLDAGNVLPLARFRFTAVRVEPVVAGQAVPIDFGLEPPNSGTASGVEIDIRVAGSGDPIALEEPFELHGPGPHPGDASGLALYYHGQDRWDAVDGSFTLMRADFDPVAVPCALEDPSDSRSCEARRGTVRGEFTFDVETAPDRFESHTATFELPAYRIVITRVDASRQARPEEGA